MAQRVQATECPSYDGDAEAADGLPDGARRFRDRLLAADAFHRGLWALRVPLEHLGARIYPDMFSLAQAHTMFTEDGGLTSGTLAKRLDGTLGCFLDLVEAAKNYRELKKQWVEFLGEKPDVATDRVETVAVKTA